ncbi:MAG TPA: hypothetical protein VJ836_05915 [Candidatus Saccharimonadales bacterium]|nr:hypothetical protein [Candidatus Saccharimonadales bacterium]
MDPSQVQSDTSNDVHSLERSDDADKAAKSVAAPFNASSQTGDLSLTDTTSGQAPSVPPPPVKKRSLFKRLWERFNIYLLLFILVLVLAIAAIVFLTVKSRDTATNTINTQELSQDALKQLANTDVTVGNPKQVLTIQANAVFAGAVLVRDNLEVAGTLKVGGDLSLANLTVTGATRLGDTQANSLTLNTLSLQGALTLKSGINVTGNSSINGNLFATQITTGSLQLDGDLRLTHHVIAGGTIPSATRGSAVGGGGTIGLTGSDTSGSIFINTGGSPPAGCLVSVTFSKRFASTPRVNVTPIGSGAAGLNYYVDRSTSGFSICTTNTPAAGQNFGFDYIVLG